MLAAGMRGGKEEAGSAIAEEALSPRAIASKSERIGTSTTGPSPVRPRGRRVDLDVDLVVDLDGDGNVDIAALH